jgi:nicotinamide-nucleotide amidase
LKAEIITIGDEILIGQIVDTNASWMAERLTLSGIEVVRKTTVSDKRLSILNALQNADADLVLMTGGLGPTNDDITKETLCEFFNSELKHNPEVLGHILDLFEPRGIPVLEVNKKQALVLEGCTVLKNESGTAPGMWMEKDNRVYISMPGVPFEMKGIMDDYVFPELKKKYVLPVIYHRTVLTAGMGEAELASIIGSWEAEIKQQGMSLAFLPSPGQVRLRITATGLNYDELSAKVEKSIEELYLIIPQLIFGEETQTLEEVLGNLLIKKNKTISIAESCTGGYISHLITSIPGSSAYYLGSITSYSNEIKEKELAVKKSNLDKYGAVSKQVVEEMVVGVKDKFKSDYAIATSGIAGPSGGSAEKPVGTIWIAISTPNGVLSKKFILGNNRERNIKRAALIGLNWIRKEIIQD